MRSLAAAATVAALVAAGCGGATEKDSKATGLKGASAEKKQQREAASANEGANEDTDGDGLANNIDPHPNEAGDGPSDDPTSDAPAAPSPIGKKLPVESSDTSLEVTATKVLDPLPAGDSETEPGNRFVGIQFTVQNVGESEYDDASGNTVALLTTDGSQAESSTVFGGPCEVSGNDFLAKVAPGDSRQGCVPFEVAAGAKLDKIQFTPDSGFSDDTAEWKAP